MGKGIGWYKCESYQSVFIKDLKEQPVILRTHLCWQQINRGHKIVTN